MYLYFALLTCYVESQGLVDILSGLNNTNTEIGLEVSRSKKRYLSLFLNMPG